jgi:hypothetical protein
MKRISTLLIAALVSTAALAQEDKKGNDNMPNEIMISPDGMTLGRKGEEKDDKRFSVEVGMIDIGVNTLMDNSNYASATTKAFLQVPSSLQNENLFSLRNGKSINVNIVPVAGKWRIYSGDKQKIHMGLGVGLQMYNFRFTKDISYLNNTTPEIIMDTVGFTKNKLGLTYLYMPLMMTFKTKLGDKAWLVYGAGVSAGYRVSSWTKQVSAARGKDKNHDKFNFADFNTCVTGEIGLDGYFRLFASYQMTALHDNALDQKPISIGIRFGGL